MSALRAELLRIRDEHGRLTPEVIVEEWRSPEHPFHDRLPWEDSEAAEAWRRHVAHDLIQSVRVTYKEADATTGPKSVRAFHAVRTEAGHVYEAVETIAADPLLMKMVLGDMEREWRSLKSRYDKFREFWQLVGDDLAKAS